MAPIDELSSEQRNINPYLHIDPGFINLRKCFSVFGNSFVAEYESRRQPGEHWPNSVLNDHLAVDLTLRFSKEREIKTLSEILQNPQPGQLFCSTEKLSGNDEVYNQDRVRNRIVFPFEEKRIIEVEFSTRHIVSDTGRLEQSKESEIAIIGTVRQHSSEVIIIHPLIMGAPTFDHAQNRRLESNQLPDLMWYGYDWYQTFPGDIDEFSKIKETTDPDVAEWTSYMKNTPEDDVKNKFCDLLKDVSKKDWGGELDDHFSTSVHLSTRRVTAAFAFKGPARFREMTPDLLGKRADQIFRLASTPAELLIVQHCHAIGEAVRATLRAFAVAPHQPRRYCLIDGKDTYKIFSAYSIL